MRLRTIRWWPEASAADRKAAMAAICRDSSVTVLVWIDFGCEHWGLLRSRGG